MLLILLSLLQAYEFAEIDAANVTKYNVTTKLMYVYSRPTLRSLPVGRLTKGQVIEGDKVEKHENLTWISYLEKNKTRRYVIAKDQRNQCFVDPCPNATNVTRHFKKHQHLEMDELDEAANTQYNVTTKLMYIYSKPSLLTLPVGRLVKGQVIEGDKIEKHSNITWVSFLEKNKTRRYVIGKDIRGQCFLAPCPNATNVTRRFRVNEDSLEEISNTQYNVTTKLMYVYSRPTMRSLPVGRLTKGHMIEGDKVEKHENLTWISFLEKNKTRRYVVAKDQRGQCFVDPCPNATNVTRRHWLKEILEADDDEYFIDEEDTLEEVSDAAYKVTSRLVNVYNKPTLRSPIVGRLMKGHVIESDKIEKHENLTWVSYETKNKTRHYVIGKDYRGQCNVDPCPEVPTNEFEAWRRKRGIFTGEVNIDEFDEEMDYDEASVPTNRCGNNVAFLQNDFASSCPAIKKSGCLFLAICYMGGICNQQEVLNFWQWCVRNGKVNGSNAYIQVGTDSLVNDCVNLYHFGRRAGSATTNAARSHWWVVSGGKVVYNSVPGWF